MVIKIIKIIILILLTNVSCFSNEKYDDPSYLYQYSNGFTINLKRINYKDFSIVVPQCKVTKFKKNSIFQIGLTWEEQYHKEQLIYQKGINLIFKKLKFQNIEDVLELYKKYIKEKLNTKIIWTVNSKRSITKSDLKYSNAKNGMTIQGYCPESFPVKYFFTLGVLKFSNQYYGIFNLYTIRDPLYKYYANTKETEKDILDLYYSLITVHYKRRF